ncbi:hypothetical protein GDO78_011175 [Eleutherodactylus coqui]|uniref:G-protein coupled receptors family 1 profile domain-containing protein n=1 Tax=Eleutherodactylus coqui TaxID=57060 RepID=A0A8J6K8A7_ELECQ|nr:hypothetical protein GDO78_011175 [Eleutherodactylus coqui]
MYHNVSKIQDIILSGFSDLQQFRGLLFMVFLFIYLFIVFGNGLIALLVLLEPSLQFPMYSFIGTLSCIEICCTAVTIPKMLSDLLVEKRTSFSGCLLQAYFLHVLVVAECYVLTIMAYDRYLAICKPLRYSAIMTTACSDIRLLKMVESSLSSVIMVNFVCVLLSYIKVVIDILKIKSEVGRQKAFSTCGAHLMVVVLFFGSIGFMYIRIGKSYSADYNRAVGLTYAVFVPLANPVIYGLRNQEIKKSFKKLFSCSHFKLN